MNKLSFFILLLHVNIIFNLQGQELEKSDSIFPKGISIQYGYGRYSIRDEYISDNRYTGALPEYNIRWTNYHKNHGYELNFYYGQSSKVKDYNAVTDIQEFSVSGRHLYFIKDFYLAGKPVYLFLGPSWDFYFHLRNQNMAYSLFTKTTSLASFISGGINIKGIMPLSPKIQIESSLGTNIFSLVARLPDLDIEEAKYLKILALPLVIDAYHDLSINYRISNAFSVGAGYHFRLTRIHSSSSIENSDGWYSAIAVNNYTFINVLWHIGN